MDTSAEYSPFGPLGRPDWVSARHRPGVDAIDQFARSARAIVAGGQSTHARMRQLSLMEDALERCFHGEATSPAFAALRSAVRDHCLPFVAFQSLLAAYRTELTTTRYATFAQLLQHCGAAANPIGQLVLLVYGHREPALHRFSDAVCTGLRLTAALRELGSDLARGRCTIPQEDLIHFGVDKQALEAESDDPEVRELLQFQATRARSMLQRGAPLLRQVDPALRRPLAERVRRGLETLETVAVGSPCQG